MSKIETCWGSISEDMRKRLSCIKLVAFDVDGTLTDGGIYYDNGDIELKRFHSKDGYGIAALALNGIISTIITGRTSNLVERRARDLKIKYVVQGVSDKKVELSKLQQELHISKEETAAIGDDLNDLPLFAQAGFTFCPGDAHPYIKDSVDYCLTMPGGRGAAREMCDLILMAQGKLNLQGGPV